MSENPSFWRDKSHENLLAAELCFNSGYLESSVNRAYFAAFHAAIYVLSLNGFRNLKNPHEWVQSTFAKELIHRKKLYPIKYSRVLLNLMDTRHSVDYSEVQVSYRRAKLHLEMSKDFVSTVLNVYSL